MVLSIAQVITVFWPILQSTELRPDKGKSFALRYKVNDIWDADLGLLSPCCLSFDP